MNRRSILPEPRPSTSRYDPVVEPGEEPYEPEPQEVDTRVEARELTPEERARQMVKDAERAKAKIFATTGNQNLSLDVHNQYVHSAMVDETYDSRGSY